MVDESADVGEGGGRGVVIDVEDKDGPEELGGEEGVVGGRGEVDGGMDEIALAVVVGASDQEFEVLVIFGIVDYFCEFLE